MCSSDLKLENYGQFAVPHLVNIVQNHADEEIRRVAAKKFSENARGRLFKEYRHLSGIQALELKKEHDREFERKNKSSTQYEFETVNFINRKVIAENSLIKSLWYTRKDSEGQKKKVVASIVDWYATHKHWYQYSGFQKLRITLFETRFARYWWNLLHVDFGISHVDKRPVIGKVISKLRYSITLSLTAVLLSYFIAVPLGIFSAVKHQIGRASCRERV